MASSSSFSFILVFTILFLSTQICSSSAQHLTHTVAKRVAVSLYYDSFDSQSSSFITKFLPNMYEDNLVEIADLTLIPYGKVRVGGRNEVFCKRGPNECLLSRVEVCAIHVLHEDGYVFIYCAQYLVSKGLMTGWKSCFDLMRLDKKPVEECSISNVGKRLELQYANETSTLIPHINSVPWLTVNGVPLKNDYKNFKKAICNAYKGPPSDACKKIKANQNLEVGDADEASQTTEFRLPEITWMHKVKV